MIRTVSTPASWNSKLPFVSVIVCTYNRANRLRTTLDTLLDQQGVDRAQWELIVVDNNSTDDTREVVEGPIVEDKHNIRYLFEPRQGKSYALNTGIENASGQVLAFTDDDVLVDTHWIASIIEACSTYPHRLFGGKTLPLWPASTPSWIDREGPYSRPTVGGPIVSHDRGDEIKEYGKGMWAPIGSNMFFRKDVLDEYGGFRNDFCPRGDTHYWTAEDCELCFRIMNNGEKALYYPKALVHHPVPVDKLSQEYLLKYALDGGYRGAKMEIQDHHPNLLRRSRTILKCAQLAAERLLKYLFTYHKAAAKFHHKTMLYHFSARLYSYATVKAGTRPTQSHLDGSLQKDHLQSTPLASSTPKKGSPVNFAR